MKIWKSISPTKPNGSNRISLSLILVVPFVIQIFGAAGLIGYFSYKNGKESVKALSTQVRNEVSRNVSIQLDHYLSTPIQLNRLNQYLIDRGLVDLNNFEDLGHLFWKEMTLFDVGYINYEREDLAFIGVERQDSRSLLIHEYPIGNPHQHTTYQADDQGNWIPISSAYEADISPEAWYTDALKAGKLVWTQIYAWTDNPGILSISSSLPIYDQKNQFLGVIGVDLILTQINQFLQRVKVSLNSKIFIIERNGNLVSSSDEKLPFKLVNGEAQLLPAKESSDPIIRSTTQFLDKHYGGFNQIKKGEDISLELAGVPYFVNVLPWRDQYGLDWLIVVTVPESDLMEQVNLNTKITLLICFAALASASLLALRTAHWIIRPIQQLGNSSQAVARGDFGQKSHSLGIAELDILSDSFNQMTDQLKESFETLESRVQQRTVELNQALQTAESANKAKSQFLSAMSHELRTPLNAILGFTQLMQFDSNLTPQQQENLSIMNDSGAHLLALINDVLSMAKVESGQMLFNPSRFDVYRLLSSLSEMFKLQARSKGLSLEFTTDPLVPRLIYTDEQKLRQVLINLIGNALKFTEVGKVTVALTPNLETTEGEIPTITVEIKDTGVGISPLDQEKLFEPFVQTESGRTLQQGTGLGLSLSKKLLQLMGGDIAVQSALGQGSTFTFSIPIE